MNKHSKSLLFSIVVHSLLLAAVFYLYTAASSAVKVKPVETKICIKLGNIHQTTIQSSNVKKKEIKKRVEKKQKKVKKKPKRPTPKKLVKKKVHVKQSKKVKSVVKKDFVKKSEVLEKKISPEIKRIVEPTAVCPQKQQKICQCKVCQCENKTLKTKQIDTTKEHYVNRHLKEIARLLQENLYYPRRARKRGIEGKVIVRFTLQENAKIKDIEIISSDKDVLSRGAIKTLENLSGEFPKPDEELILTVPISYRLSH